jgi:biopolymer transport protein ExbD
MRIRVPQSRRGMDRITINLAAMIDVSFLLLFYFMVATMLQDRETRLSAGLQTMSSRAAGPGADFQTQSIDVHVIDGQPTYQVGARMCEDRQALAEVLESLPKEGGMLVKVFDGVEVGFAVAAIQVARDAGFQQVTYVAASQ